MNISRIWKDEKERQAYAYIIRLTLPIVIQNLFSAAVSSVDVLMLNSVGQASISAVSLATQYSNILVNVFIGVSSGIAMLGSQYWGKGDLPTIERVQGIALRFAILFTLLFGIPSIFVPEVMMKIYTNDPELIAIGSSYLRIVGFSHIFWGLAETYFATLRSIERVKICTYISVATLLLNIGLNAVFIYGLFGAPKLGATGVALATAISRIAQFVACMVVSRTSKDIKLNFTSMFANSRLLMKDFIRLSIPALANNVIWSIGFSMYSVIMGYIGSDVVAANSIVSVVKSFGTVFCYAVAGSAGIYVGKDIGANKMEQAAEDAKRSMVLTIITGVMGGVVILAITPLAMNVASLSTTAMGYMKIMLIINSVYIMGIAVNSTLIIGVFRAGGDSKFGLICDTIDMWAYAVPLGFIAAFVLKLPPMVVYFLLCTDEFVKWPWVIKHYKSKKWLINITRDTI